MIPYLYKFDNIYFLAYICLTIYSLWHIIGLIKENKKRRCVYGYKAHGNKEI
jgi:hypothetical protein